ncbi:MAG: sulfatase-like hydrolase/transferase [Planctomycetota bacterium]|nr:sulfatase-like hydrolase/transferase [Planctomycetota bacterium]
MSRPNILFICTDQQSSTAMSCAGNRDLETPAVDRLAESGVCFENAYCAFPLCTPSRASLFSGFMPHEIGVMQNGNPIPEELRDQEMGNLFNAAGYDCGYAGKWHVPEGSITEEHGFRKLHDFGDIGLAGACIEFLKEEREQPFLLVASYDNPHNICEWARQQNLPYGNIPRVPLDECPNLPANFAVQPFAPDALEFEKSFNHEIHPTQHYTDEDWRHFRHAYFRLTEKVDAEIGRILDQVREQNLEENTLIIFTSDHGDGHGSHHWNQKSSLYEESIRIPFIVSFKGVTAADRKESGFVSNGLDILPTMCDYAGIEIPENLRGRSVRKLAEGHADNWREEVFVETSFPKPAYRGTQGRAVRTERFKYSVYSMGRYREQLIDMENDPGEMVNLAVESRYRGILQDHRDRLSRWCGETGDSFKVPCE